MAKNTHVYLLLGSNVGDRFTHLADARHALAKSVGPLRNKSSIYRTAAWGKTDQPEFYNQVLAMETSLDPVAVLDAALDIEKHMGRERKEKWAARTIDIDILFYGAEIIDTPRLRVPHPQLPVRRFALVPLHEIAPLLVHPALGTRVEELLYACSDTLEVEKLDRIP
jgi:2-amino-4-hydroxy-6-hydroxymethyldihydropteridine diphosphokinase